MSEMEVSFLSAFANCETYCEEIGGFSWPFLFAFSCVCCVWWAPSSCVVSSSRVFDLYYFGSEGWRVSRCDEGGRPLEEIWVVLDQSMHTPGRRGFVLRMSTLR